MCVHILHGECQGIRGFTSTSHTTSPECVISLWQGGFIRQRLHGHTGGRRWVFLVNTKTTPNLHLETIRGTWRVPVWLSGWPRCFNDIADKFQSFPAKQRTNNEISFQQDDIYWQVRSCRTWSNRWCISNSLIYQYIWYIGKLHRNIDCWERHDSIMCYKKDLIIHTNQAGLRPNTKIKTIKRFLCTNCANQKLLRIKYKENIQSRHTKDFH